MTKREPKYYVDKIERLPPAPTVLIELLDLFKQPDRDIDRVVELISMDPALTAEVLKLCNSAFFASDMPVEDMFEAVSRIGFYEVYRLVAAVSGSRMLEIDQGQAAGTPHELWTHAVTVALAAETLAEQGPNPEGAAFTAGLLHDIGKVVLASAESEVYPQVLSGSRDRGLPVEQLENELFGVDHAVVGGYLLAQWKLPSRLVAAVRQHHLPPESQDEDHLVLCTFAANALVRLDRTSSSGGALADSVLPNALAALHLAADAIPELLQCLDQKLEKASGLLAVQG